MHLRLRQSLALIALLAFVPCPTRATTVVPPTFDRLVGSADYIVRVEVKSVTSQWRDNSSHPGERYIGSQIALAVREVIKGTPPEPLVLDVVGGRVGDTELSIEGIPQLVPGQECILFVKGNGRTIFPLVGLMNGYFPVRRDARTGDAQVLRHDGRLLYGTDEIAPESQGPRAARSPLDRPLTPQAFRDRIQQQQRDILSREKQK